MDNDSGHTSEQVDNGQATENGGRAAPKEEDEAVSAASATGEKKSSRWPEPIGSIRDAFKEDRRGAEFQRLITEQFSKAENPYESALYLTEHSPDVLQPRVNTMSVAILKDFSVWIRAEGREEQFRHLLIHDIQRRAFSMATRRHTVLLKTAVDVFHLIDVAETFVDDVRAMASKGQFREAAECATALGIQRYFGLNEILIPCILQDKVNFVEPFLENVVELQQEVVEALDELCSPRVDIDQFLRHYRVSGIRKDKLCVKPLQKLVARLSKLYNIPAEKTPNLTLTRSQGTLKYLLHRRYDEKVMHDDNWHDMVRQGIETCPSLLGDLFNLLCYTYKDLAEAAKWAGYFHISPTMLPEKLQRYIDEKPEALYPKNGIESDESEKHKTIVNGDFLALPLPASSILMVDNEETLSRAMTEIGAALIVGVDSEWQPGFGKSIENVALLQVATEKTIFLLDILALKNSVGEESLKNAMRTLFDFDIPRKIGFGFGCDMKTLALTLPHCREEFENMSNTVCVSELIKHLLHEDPDFIAGIPNPRFAEAANGNVHSTASNDEAKVLLSAKVNFNLAELCYHLLGRPLDKSEQYSNWSRRPLRWHQMRYAALDAYCLLPIFEKLRVRAVELKVDFERAVLRSLVKGSKALAVGRDRPSAALRSMRRAELLDLIQKLNETLESAEATSTTLRPFEVRVVADNMLQGLGRHLRRCGVDCLIAENHASREIIIEAAKKERRILLTCGSVVPMAAGRLPSDLICAVPSSINAKEQLAWFLRKMHIRVTEEDIFSRCMICNSPEFLLVSSRLLRVIYDAVVAPTDALSVGPFDRKKSYESIQSYLRDGIQDETERLDSAASDSCQPPFDVDDEQWIFTFGCGAIDCQIDLLSGAIVPAEGAEPVRVQIESIPAESAFSRISLFYVCRSCGKIYWDGSHTNRYVSELRDVMEFEQLDGADKETE